MKLNLNLASRRYVNKRALDQGFVAAFCLLLLFCGWSLFSLLQENAALRLQQDEVSEVAQQIQALRGGPEKTLTPAQKLALEKEYAIVKELLDQDAFRWTSLLDKMENLVPEGVNFNGFRPDYNKKSLAISGRARDLKQMRKFLDQLIKDGGFEQVFLKSHSRLKVRDYADVERDAITFSVQLEGVF